MLGEGNGTMVHEDSKKAQDLEHFESGSQSSSRDRVSEISGNFRSQIARNLADFDQDCLFANRLGVFKNPAPVQFVATQC